MVLGGTGGIGWYRVVLVGTGVEWYWVVLGGTGVVLVVQGYTGWFWLVLGWVVLVGTGWYWGGWVVLGGTGWYWGGTGVGVVVLGGTGWYWGEVVLGVTGVVLGWDWTWRPVWPPCSHLTSRLCPANMCSTFTSARLLAPSYNRSERLVDVKGSQ